MDLEGFQTSLAHDRPPGGLTAALRALWWDAKGDWDKAHECAQAKEDMAGCWVHAYLHRKEGDPGNAAYWYRRADKPAATISLAQEWRQIVGSLLAGSGQSAD